MSTDPSLVFARKMCAEHRFITVPEHGKTYIYRDGYYKPIRSPKNAGHLHNLIIESENGEQLSPAGRDKIIRNIESITIVPTHKVNPEGIFNFQDCLFDVRSNNKAEHSPDYYITTQIPYRFNESVDCPMWLKFLNNVTENNINKINILQEFVGYCLMKSCKYERALFLMGQGSNGKSTFTETIISLFGRENCSGVSLQNMSNPVLRGELLNKYINIDSDLPKNAIDFEEVFRKVTSGEAVQFNEKFLPPVTLSTSCKLIYCLNDLPSIHDTSSAFYRRMLLIPFEIEIAEENQDINLKDKLKAELGGIFRWAVQGYRRLIKQERFSQNLDMKKEIAEIRVDNNPVLAFAHEFLDFSNQSTAIVKQSMYQEYKKWTINNGNKPISFRKFNRNFYNSFKNQVVDKDYLSGYDRLSSWKNVAYNNTSMEGQRVIGFNE